MLMLNFPQKIGKKIDLMISKFNELGKKFSEKDKKCITEYYFYSTKELRLNMYNFISSIKKGISEDEQEKIFIDKFGMNWDDFDEIMGPFYSKCF